MAKFIIIWLIPQQFRINFKLRTQNLDSAHMNFFLRISLSSLEGTLPKSYSILTTSHVPKEQNVKKAKGVILKGSTIDHDSYLEAYNDSIVVNIPQTKIGSRNHQLFTFKSNKKALSCYDNKRRWLTKNKSVAYGHYLDVE